MGLLRCDEQRYRVVYYEWVESKSSGKAIHAAYRLLFIDTANHYLGSYSIADQPVKLTNDSILFAYPRRLGNRIGCRDIGPGKRVLLNGESQPFFK